MPRVYPELSGFVIVRVIVRVCAVVSGSRVVSVVVVCCVLWVVRVMRVMRVVRAMVVYLGSTPA